MSETKLYFLINEQTYSLVDMFNIKILEIKRDSPQPVPNYVSFSGVDGKKHTQTDFDLFTINVRVSFQASDFYEYHIKLSEFQSLIFQRDPYYIFHNMEPGKRFRVVPRPMVVDRETNKHATIDIVFDVFEGCAESIGTTLNAVNLDSDEWQFSQGIVMENYQYIHETNDFEIWNLGDLIVDPREHPLVIKIEGISEGDVTIRNKTTGECFIYYNSLFSNRGEVLTINGVYPFKNGAHVGIDTNGELISLISGKNEIQVSNISRLKISFEFRFRYK